MNAHRYRVFIHGNNPPLRMMPRRPCDAAARPRPKKSRDKHSLQHPISRHPEGRS